jgi:tetratricopeptide (TPR) repeat protein
VVDLKPAQPGHFFARVLADQHYQKGRDAEQQGDWERALGAYRRACAIDAHNALYLLARGHICQTHGLEQEAEECYQRVLMLRPGDTVALYNQAHLFAARGCLDEARTNLAQIVSGSADDLGERLAPVHCRLGDIALRRAEFTLAGVHFRRALQCDPRAQYAAAALSGLERFAEFRPPFTSTGQIGPKTAFYCYAGAMLLGFPGSAGQCADLLGDDGIAIPPYAPLGFDTLDEVARTLFRFVDLTRCLGWRFDCVAPLDSGGRPLAAALAAALDASVIPSVEDVPWKACVLGVAGAARDPAEIVEGARTLGQRSRRALCYTTGAERPIWEYGGAIQVASLPVRVEFPWSRNEAAVPEHAEAIGAALAEALLAPAACGTARDGALRVSARTARRPVVPTCDATMASTRRQVAWYRRHHQLSFDLGTLEATRPTGHHA